MGKKMGRPPTPKRKAKSVLFGAKLSPPEAKEAGQAIAAAGQDKSKWLRAAIEEKIERQRTKEFIDSLCQGLRQGDKPKDLEASLSAVGLPLSTGKFSFDTTLAGQGHYYPNDSGSLEKYPLHGAILKLSGRNERLLVTNIQRCLTASRPAYHLWFEAVD